jgi:RNA polymerase sigma factor (sigma-70 family)
MSFEEQGSITRWLVKLKAGDPTAAQLLWARYYEQLIRLAQAKLVAAHRPSAEADEEDAVLSAFFSVCEGMAAGQYPQIGDRDDLWQLLVLVTARKALAYLRRARRQKRGGGKILRDSDLHSIESGETAYALENIVGPEATPEFMVMMAEEVGILLDALEEESLRKVAQWRMEGYTCDEIASQLDCARRTVARRLELIREIWLDLRARADTSKSDSDIEY